MRGQPWSESIGWTPSLEGVGVRGLGVEEVWGDLEPTAREARPSAGLGGPDEGPGGMIEAVAWMGARLGETSITSVLHLVTVDSE